MWDEAKPELLSIDKRARAWQRKLIECWAGHGCPAIYPFKDALVAALLLHNGMNDGPLPDDRLDLIYAATRREEPSREAFVTLALLDYVEDFETLPVRERSAKLPYQLAWAREGWTLSERTGLPGGIFKARWPEAPE